MANRLAIHAPNGIHGWGLEFESEDMSKIEEFVVTCRKNLSKDLGYFHQSGCMFDGKFAHYQFFEFWKVDVSEGDSISFMIDECLKIAELIREELSLI